ncbi:hypothetical protein TNCV_1778951 [Trichonephila clavipes]|nr:hypothetical protein TNCV_1778951 [Trichonephila clavipes]
MGYGSPVVKVSDHGRHLMSSSPVPLRTRRAGQRCTPNLSRAETSSCWCGAEARLEKLLCISAGTLQPSFPILVQSGDMLLTAISKY